MRKVKKLKIVLVGSNAVGKTSIANRFTRNLFANRYINTTGCDFYVKTIDFKIGKETEKYKIILFDLGSHLEFREFRLRYMASADIVFVVFAVNDAGSFNVQEYIDDVLALPSKPAFALVGNKVDLVDAATLDLSTITAITTTHDIPVFLTSAKENVTIQEMFEEMAARAIQSH